MVEFRWHIDFLVDFFLSRNKRKKYKNRKSIVNRKAIDVSRTVHRTQAIDESTQQFDTPFGYIWRINMFWVDIKIEAPDDATSSKLHSPHEPASPIATASVTSIQRWIVKHFYLHDVSDIRIENARPIQIQTAIPQFRWWWWLLLMLLPYNIFIF